MIKKVLKAVAWVLGTVWSFPGHGMIAVLLLISVYWPRRLRWRNGALHVIPRRRLIPEGLDRTGDGDYDDSADFVTGAQTHWIIIFCRDESNWDRDDLMVHETVHVRQCQVLGGILHPLTYGLSYAINRFIKRQPGYDAYRNIWHEKQAYRIEEEYVTRQKQNHLRLVK